MGNRESVQIEVDPKEGVSKVETRKPPMSLFLKRYPERPTIVQSESTKLMDESFNGSNLVQLPDLCMRKIFAFLDLRDLFKCRAVSRQFRFYAEEIVINQLVIADARRSCETKFCKTWYLTEKPIDLRNSISWMAFSSLRPTPPKPKFLHFQLTENSVYLSNSITRNTFPSPRSTQLKLDQRLKFLHIHLNYPKNFNLNILNRFQQLVHLEVKVVVEPLKTTLDLPNLKVLAVSSPIWFSLDAPQLEVLKIPDMGRMKLRCPRSVKQLRCFAGLDRLEKLTSLEVLSVVLPATCYPKDSLHKIRSLDLDSNLKLRELNLYLSLTFYAENEHKDFKSSLSHLISERERLKREDLSIFLNDVLFLDVKQLGSYESVKSENTFLFKNYKMLRRPCPEIKYLDFVEVLKTNVQLSSEFFDRFPKIKKVHYEVDNDLHSEDQLDAFEWFLKNAREVRTLVLRNTGLAHHNLPHLNDQLEHLKVNDPSVSDFNFILQLEQLKKFEAEQHFEGALELAEKTFQQRKMFDTFGFQSDHGEPVQIVRSAEQRYELWIWEKHHGKLLCEFVFGQRNLRWTELVAHYKTKREPPTTEETRRKLFEELTNNVKHLYEDFNDRGFFD